jgi:hypothetical protein
LLKSSFNRSFVEIFLLKILFYLGYYTILRITKTSHVSSIEAKAMEQYLASVLDLAIVGCFFALHERQLGHKKVQNPEVD